MVESSSTILTSPPISDELKQHIQKLLLSEEKKEKEKEKISEKLLRKLNLISL